MSWAKVKPGKKPLKWWWHKILCEIGYAMRRIDSCKMYYYHLEKLCKQGFNLYGEPIKPNPEKGKI